MTTLECMECGYREVFTEQQFKFTDGFSCDVCNGPVRPTVTRTGDKLRNRRMREERGQKTIRVGTVTVDIDVSNALAGLKAVQREAKKASAALREVEQLKIKE